VLDGMDILDIVDTINNNTFRGLPARVKLNQWKRI